MSTIAHLAGRSTALGNFVLDAAGVLQRHRFDVGVSGLAMAGAGYSSSDVVSSS